MRAKPVVMALLTLLLTGGTARAGGINLFEGDCGMGAAHNSITNLCSSNETTYHLYGSVVVPTTINSFFYAFIILDLQSSETVLPDWWAIDVGGCRETAVDVTFDAATAGGASCSTIWGSSGTVTPDFAFFPEGDGQNRLRCMGAGYGSVPGTINAGPAELGVFRMTLLGSNTTGAGACAGCETGACIVFNELQLIGSELVTLTNPVTNNHVSYNNAADTNPLCPASTPTRNRTWGSLKALYR